MFNAARAALLRHNPDFRQDFGKTHSSLISAFSLHFVKNGHIPLEYGRMFNRLEELRLIADYKNDSIEADKADTDLMQFMENALADLDGYVD